MSEYIKKEDAQRALVHTLKDAKIDNACNEQGWYFQGLMDAGVAIDAVPGADVVEVRHGRWIRTGQSYINPNKFLCLTCSCCLSDLDEHIRKEPRYCPYCGAKMDGEEKE